MITSRQHPIVKEFRDLARGAGPLMLLDGWHLLGEAADARVAVEKIAICGPPTAKEKAVVDRLRRAGAQVVDVSGTVLNALSPVNSPTGVVASARIPSVTSASVLTPAPALVLAAAGLQDPGNAGAIIRSAAAAGATGVVLDELSADPWGWKALRASMGSAFHVPGRAQPRARGADRANGAAPACASSPPCRAAARRCTTSTSRSRPRCCSAAKAPACPTIWSTAADTRVSIPMHGAIESLNAAVAAAVLFYEAQRQRASALSRTPNA